MKKTMRHEHDEHHVHRSGDRGPVASAREAAGPSMLSAAQAGAGPVSLQRKLARRLAFKRADTDGVTANTDGEFGAPAPDPVNALRRGGRGAYQEWQTATGLLGDCDLLANQADRLQRAHDPQSKTAAEFRSTVSMWRAALSKTLAAVPAIDEQQYSVVGSAEWKRIEQAMGELYQRFHRVSDGLIDARERIRAQVGAWLDAEANQAEEEDSQITLDYAPLLSKGERAAVEAQQGQKVDHAEVLHNVTGRGQVFSGEAVSKALAPVDADRARDANQLAIAEAVERVSAYTDQKSGQGSRRFSEIEDMVWDANSGSTMSAAWQQVERTWWDKRAALGALISKNADGQALKAQVESNIAGIEGWFRQIERTYVDGAAAARDLETIATRCKQGADDAERGMRAALPAMREAVVQHELRDEYRSRAAQAERDRAALLQSGAGVSSDDAKRRLAGLDTLPDEMRGKVGPQWFTYTRPIKELSELVKKDKAFTPDQAKAAGQQADLASAMDDYQTWSGEIGQARAAIERNPDARAKAESLKELGEFQKEIEERYAKKWKAALGEQDVSGVIENMNQIREEINKVILEGDGDSTIDKLAHKALWKGIESAMGKRILGDGNAERLAHIHGGLEKATKLMSQLAKADKIWHMNDQTSMVEGAGNPTLDAISSALDLASDFDKVPFFGKLCGMYATAVGNISKQVAKLQQELMHEKLAFAVVDGTFSRR